MNKITLTTITLISAITVVACSDFGNSKKSASEGNGIYGELAPPQKNPFPPGEGYEKPNEGEFSEQKMLVNIGVNIIAKAAKNFSRESEALSARAAEYCEVLAAGDEALHEEGVVRAQWKEAMLAYHAMESIPVGPLTDAGRYIADNIYSWPYFNACGVDLETIHMKEDGTSRPQKLFTVKGLRALEYLLFEPSLNTSCNIATYPKAAAWAAQTPAAKRLQRCRYAADLTLDLSAKAKLLDLYWDPMEGNFSKTFVDGSRYPSIQEATNAMSDALFVLEILKDQKLGRPLGRHKDCTDASGKCPGDVEHPWSGLGLQALEAQLEMFKAVFFGHNNPRVQAFGFDDFLASKGRADVAELVRLDLERTLASHRGLAGAGSLQEQIQRMDASLCAATTVTDRKVPICAFFQDLRSVTTTMKVEVLSILKLRAPPFFGGGDND